jgi:integration host factor subunit beta
VTKKDIVKAISEQIGMTQLKTKEIVQQTFDAIIDTLVRERRIELRNFGVFEVKKRAARKARNPRTGERVEVAEKFVVTFKPGKEMEERVRQLERDEARKAALAREQVEQKPAAVIEPPKPVTPPQLPVQQPFQPKGFSIEPDGPVRPPTASGFRLPD